MSESLRGQLLVASPALVDPNFRRTVVLVVAHDEDGAVGIVLNRPTDTEVVEAVPDLAELVEPDAVVSIGGPVQDEAVVVLAEWEDTNEAGSIVFENVGLMNGDSDSDRIVAATRRVRIFAGLRRLGRRPARGRARGAVVDPRARPPRGRLRRRRRSVGERRAAQGRPVYIDRDDARRPLAQLKLRYLAPALVVVVLLGAGARSHARAVQAHAFAGGVTFAQSRRCVDDLYELLRRSRTRLYRAGRALGRRRRQRRPAPHRWLEQAGERWPRRVRLARRPAARRRLRLRLRVDDRRPHLRRRRSRPRARRRASARRRRRRPDDDRRLPPGQSRCARAAHGSSALSLPDSAARRAGRDRRDGALPRGTLRLAGTGVREGAETPGVRDRRRLLAPGRAGRRRARGAEHARTRRFAVRLDRRRREATRPVSATTRSERRCASRGRTCPRSTSG